MIVDASAALAVLLRESNGPAFAKAFASESELWMSPINYVEASVRLMKLGKPAEELDMLMELSEIKLTAVSIEQAHFAREAYRRFGKGNHAAKLNIGDCFAYALSKARGEPLLLKGEDFRKTDVEAAI